MNTQENSCLKLNAHVELSIRTLYGRIDTIYIKVHCYVRHKMEEHDSKKHSENIKYVINEHSKHGQENNDHELDDLLDSMYLLYCSDTGSFRYGLIGFNSSLNLT